MSIATELSTLSGAINTLSIDQTNIITALSGKGVTATGHGFGDFATDITNIPSGGGGGSAIPSDLPNDGKTRICYRVPAGKTGDDLKVTLCFFHDSDSTQTTVDWGDSTTPVVSTGEGEQALTHSLHVGDNVVTLTVNSGSITIGSDDEYESIYGGFENLYSGNSRQFIYWCVTGNNVALSGLAFYFCTALKSFKITTGNIIGDEIFVYCNNLTDVELPSELTTLGVRVFKDCVSLTTITIPNGVTQIEEDMFYGCKQLTTVNMPAGITSIGDNAFLECSSLKSITLPSGLTTLGANAFKNCYNLTSITFPSGLTLANANILYNNLNLTQLTIPATMTSLKTNAFSSLRGTQKIRFNSTTPPTIIGNDTPFPELVLTCVISVPVGSLDAYTSAEHYPSSDDYTYIEEN